MAKKPTGSGRLTGKKAVITGGDSGIGRAVAIAYAREGADILISYLCEDEDAAETKSWSRRPGGKPSWCRGDIQGAAHCRNDRRQGRGRTGWHRHPRQQCRAPGEFQGHRGHLRRGMGADLPRQHPRDVLSDQGCRAAHEARQRRSSTPPPSIPTSQIRPCSPMRRPRAPSTISRPGSRSCWPRRASASTRWRRDRSGRRSSPRRCRRTPCPISASRCR